MFAWLFMVLLCYFKTKWSIFGLTGQNFTFSYTYFFTFFDDTDVRARGRTFSEVLAPTSSYKLKFCADFKSEIRFALLLVLSLLPGILREKVLVRFRRKWDISHPDAFWQFWFHILVNGINRFVSSSRSKWI